MRIATFVISILLVIVMLLQSCAVFGLGSISDNLGSETGQSDTTSGGAVGILSALTAFIGMAFVLKKPTVSLVMYAISALFAFIASTSGFSDMNIWGVVLLILAGMAFFSRQELRKEEAAKTNL